ncbi:MAG TPA: efflux RND transporter periplasmic adaptor subunit [Elusimicrobiota bacterium]|nr:efflux RND transporter periplasmic adaptor subunit [Elusimicrobiota bacterium]
MPPIPAPPSTPAGAPAKQEPPKSDAPKPAAAPGTTPPAGTPPKPGTGASPAPTAQKTGASGTAPRPRPAGLRSGAKPGASPFKKKFVVMAAAFIGIAILMWGGVKVYRMISGKISSGKKDKGKEGSQEALAVNVLEVKQDRFQDTLVAVGTIAGGSEIPLRFEVDGMIDYFDFREGDKVRKGDVIARLNQRDAYLKMKRAELELDQYEKLYAIGGVARGRLEESRLAADLARSDLDKTVLRAARDGIVGDKDAEVGEFVTPNKKIATLVNIETVVVRVGIIEKEIDKIFPGQKVMLTVDTYPGVEFTGRVENISPLVQGTSKTLTVEARLDNEGGLLLPGMFARTRIVIFEEDNTIVVPNDSLEKTQAGFRLFVVTKDNKAEARDVEVGYVSSQFSQITKGLAPGELVVTQKPQDLKAGAPVKVIEVQK